MEITGPGSGFGFAMLPFFFMVIGTLLSFGLGLLFIVLAARFATRAVLDELAKDRARRGVT